MSKLFGFFPMFAPRVIKRELSRSEKRERVLKKVRKQTGKHFIRRLYPQL